VRATGINLDRLPEFTGLRRYGNSSFLVKYRHYDYDTNQKLYRNNSFFLKRCLALQSESYESKQIFCIRHRGHFVNYGIDWGYHHLSADKHHPARGEGQ
jgi:hypothetical protein